MIKQIKFSIFNFDDNQIDQLDCYFADIGCLLIVYPKIILNFFVGIKSRHKEAVQQTSVKNNRTIMWTIKTSENNNNGARTM